MPTKSTHTKQAAQRRYALGSSRKRHSATTLLAQLAAQMADAQQGQQLADIKRGTRIRERREELHLTQPAVVEKMEALAWQLPPENPIHPVRAAEIAAKGEAAKPPVTLRGYQTYEKGGGIVWEKAKLLARVLQVDAHAMMTGDDEDAGVPPDPFPTTLEGALAEFAQAIRKQNDLLERQSEILDRIEGRLGADEAVRDELADLIQRRGREIVEGLPPTSEPDPTPEPPRSPAAAKKPAAKPRTASRPA